MKLSPYQRRQREIDQARDHLIRAAAALTTFERDALALALYESACGMLAIARADDDLSALSKVEALLLESMAVRDATPGAGKESP